MEKKQGAFRTTIGGQALIEGILMRGPEKDAIVVRSPEGLVTKVTERKFIRSKYPILGVPILRGAVTFISSMITGVKALMFSADYFPDEEDAQPGKFDQWLEKHIPAEKLQSLVVDGIIGGVGGVLSFAPLIVIMFALIAFLEDSGYMARIAYMMDRIFRAFGLHGASVMPYIIAGGIVSTGTPLFKFE